MNEKEKIETLTISQNWKEKFLAIAETNPVGGTWTPQFEDKAKFKSLSFTTKYNLMGLLFGQFYYFVKGMWKKALVLVGITLVLSIIAGITHSAGANFASFIIPPLLAAMHGNIDYYRKVVRGEDFWW